MAWIENRIELLAEPFKTKVKVFISIIRKKYPKLAPFETIRTKERQKWLVANGKSRTMNSYHLLWKAVDWIFLDEKWNPTWTWDYKYLHYIWFFCWMTPIYNNKWQVMEMCHLQDDRKIIKTVMKNNSEKRKASKVQREKDLLNQINNEFRKYWN